MEEGRLNKKLGIAMLSAVSLWCATAQATIYDIQLDQSLYGNLNQNDVPGIGGLACGPCSVTNSLVYLQNRYPLVYGNSLVPPQGVDYDGSGTVDFYDDMIAVSLTLAGPNYMNQGAQGTFHDMLIYGKQKYIEEQAPGKTRYSAQDYFQWTNPPVAKPGYVADQTSPTWEFIYNNLLSGEDIEILLSFFGGGGHYVTVTSFHFDDANNDGLIQLAEDAFIDYIDPWTGLPGLSNIWDVGLQDGLIGVDYSGGAWLTMAVTESVPEPATLALFGIGLAGVGYGRRRKAAA